MIDNNGFEFLSIILKILKNLIKYLKISNYVSYLKLQNIFLGSHSFILLIFKNVKYK